MLPKVKMDFWIELGNRYSVFQLEDESVDRWWEDIKSVYHGAAEKFLGKS